ncbi:MAG: ABC transporter ATP-binding protein [Bifidobacteriaceae bacterium]|nr:ABC transporter ATP-binding protein [Bifidobacteriaceae bacterium]
MTSCKWDAPPMDASAHEESRARGSRGREPRPSPAIAIRGLRKSYGPKTALAGVDLTVEPGQFYGLIGPNGAGKTTIMEIAEGLRAPDSGAVFVLGAAPGKRSPDVLRRIGIQLQNTAFFTRSKAREHLTTLADIYGVERPRVAELLETFGLVHCAGTRVDKLSGGERQKLAVASALLHRPQVLFLDEPTAAMDAEARAELVRILHGLRGSQTTVLYTTHLLHEAERLCDKVAILDRGRIVADDTPERLLAASCLPSRLVLPSAAGPIESMRRLPGVLGVNIGAEGLVVQVASPGLALEGLVRAGIDVANVKVEVATLEDFFLQLTGSEYPRD